MFTRKATLVLGSSLLTVSCGALTAQAPPLASSYKAIANITSLGPGTNHCPHEQVAVGIAGNGMDLFGPYTFTEEMCADPDTGVFAGRFDIEHSGDGSYAGPFNGTFFPSGAMLEVHATWRITHGSGEFSKAMGAGTAKGVATVVDGGPGPGTIVLDGSIVVPNQ